MNDKHDFGNAAIALALLVASMSVPALVAEQAGHASDRSVSAATIHAAERRNISDSATAPRP